MSKPKINQLKLKFLSKPALLLLLLGFSVMSNLYANSVNAASRSLKNVVSKSVQQKSSTVKGKVISADDNKGIPGVNVSLKGEKVGVTTDLDGNFSINVPSADAILIFSGIGF